MKLSFDWSTAEGAQKEFCADTRTRHTAFVGGLGSGKTWSGATKTILYALGNPGALGLVCAPTYRQMRDSTLREFFKICPPDLIENWNKSEYELKLKNGTEILFRSLENYDAVRGVEAAFIWIDEANLVSYKAWRVVIGRLRQPGFPHRTWLTTTPRGRTDNWLYEEYVEKPQKDERAAKQRKTFHARTRDNIQNVGEEYILDLEATYTGEFAKQELEGEFVDIIEGQVYPQFSREHHVGYFGEEIFFEDHLPMYGFWDYGIADEGALWVAHTIQVPAHDSLPIKNADTGEYEVQWIPEGKGLVLVDLILESGQNVDFWIETVKLIEDRWKPFDGHWGDPAGEQREVSTGKSLADHLRSAGIIVRSKKQSRDTGRLAVSKLLTEKRLFISEECQMGIAAFTNYHWPLDPDGRRKPGATIPVHDWSSHPMDALRYGATALFPARRASSLDPRNLNQSRSGTTSKAPRVGKTTFQGIKNRNW